MSLLQKGSLIMFREWFRQWRKMRSEHRAGRLILRAIDACPDYCPETMQCLAHSLKIMAGEVSHEMTSRANERPKSSGVVS